MKTNQHVHLFDLIDYAESDGEVKFCDFLWCNDPFFILLCFHFELFSSGYKPYLSIYYDENELLKFALSFQS